MKNSNPVGLSGNQLKILAAIFMTIDHIGMVIFPGIRLFRIIGRLALPIFAFTFAEGCLHTRNRGKHFLTLCCMTLACQVIFTFATNSLYLSILATFTMSAALIFSFDYAKRQNSIFHYLVPAIVLIAVFFVCCVLPNKLKGTGFAVNYGFLGVMLPVLAYYGEEHEDKLFLMSFGLLVLTATSGMNQMFAIFAIPILYFYNGKRGYWHMKHFFYIYYPVHIAIIYFLGMLLTRMNIL